MDDNRRQPAVVVAILALLGAASLPQVFKNQGSGPPPPPQQRSAAPPSPETFNHDEEQDPDRRDLSPLLAFLSGDEQGGGNTRSLRDYLAAKLPAPGPATGDAPHVHCLVITLPDPVASLASAHFDELLDVVQRAVELQGFILDRAQLPWKLTSPDAVPSPDRLTRFRTGAGLAELRVETTSPPEPKGGRPGLIVFKEAFPKRPIPTVLLAFIVPESPVHGIEKAAFGRSLELIDRYFHDHLPEARPAASAGPVAAGRDAARPESERVVHIVAPCFSGSQRSLEVAIDECGLPPGRAYHLRIISNNAGQVDPKRLKGPRAQRPRCRVSFRSMVHRTTTVAEAMCSYLQEELRYGPSEVALLIESNSGLVQALAEHILKKATENEFIFPLQVSEVRKEYQKRGLLNSGVLDASGAPERLTIQPNESGAPRDMPRSFTPASSAALDEMALTQVLTTISHRRYHVVGIIATNPLDVVFLARLVRRFCPNVRLFAIQADLLFTRPENIGDLRGMLVASTYSLYPPNQWLVAPNGTTPRVLFNNQAGQGLYNAIAAHLWEMGLVGLADGHSPASPPLVEFGLPYEARVASDRPPIWIGVVGERGIFPVAHIARARDCDYLYDPSTAGGGPPLVGISARESGDGGFQRGTAPRPNPHPVYWLVCLFLFSACFAVAALTWAYVRWSIDPAKTQRRPCVGPLRFGPLLRDLNCEVAPKGYAGLAYDPQARFRDPKGHMSPYPPPLGAGIYMASINLLALVLSWYVFSHFLVAMTPYLGRRMPFLYLAYAVCLSSIAVISASFVLAILEVLGPGGLLKSSVTMIRGVFPGPARLWCPSAALRFLRVCRARLAPIARSFLRWFGVGSLLSRRHGVFWAIFVLVFAGWSLYLRSNAVISDRRLDFERITNLPSGVSPFFAILFLAGAFASWIHSQLERRRVYRLSYLPSLLPEDVVQEASQPERCLLKMRKVRQAVDRLIKEPLYCIGRVNPFLRWGLSLLLVLSLIRFGTRGMPRSLEGRGFDVIFWFLFLLILLCLVVHTLQLLSLWMKIQEMLKLAVMLPMAHAFDRIPQRFKGWFFGAEDFPRRMELVLQQNAALLGRSTPELAAILQTVFRASQGYWDWETDRLRRALAGDQKGALDSTRAVYPLLDPLWDSIPVEDIGWRLAGSPEKAADAHRAASWPLTPQDRRRLDDDEYEVLRDWTRAAEDLVALQIVRWFAPASSQLLPIMRFLVLGSLLLLLAVTSYPFDHSGWLLIVMVTLILFVAGSVGIVLVGTYRDELISRISDTAPGRLSFDSSFITSLVTMIGPLLGALFAISYDLSDILHTWFGPIFQLF